ncbi:MAG: phage integrase N-terminal SAM-like domain-containing protein [Sedimentibacter sp.]
MFQNFNKKDKNITLDEGFERFINSCILDKLSPTTIKNKRVTYKDFKQSVDKDIICCNQLTNEIVESYKSYLIKKGNMNSTINEKICTIMSIFNYFFKGRYIWTKVKQ